MPGRRARSGEAGVTLIEVMLVSVGAIILLGGAGKLFIGVARGESETRERAGLIQEARVTVEGMTREVREGYGIETAEGKRLTLLTYVNRSSCGGPPATSSIPCRVSYECGGGVCTRAESTPGGPAGAAVEVVRGAADEDVFSYSPNAADANYVGVRLRMPAGDGNEDAITLEGGVALRNAVIAG